MAIKWHALSGRSKLAAKNIAATICLKFVTILTSLIIVPLTVNYLDPTQYGIWLTISSIVGWANFFDLGLANGFKNRFAEAKAQNNIVLAKEYVSTTYVTISMIVFVLFSIILIINHFIDWSSILNISQSYRQSLKLVFTILSFFLCMNMIANIFVKLLEADQRPAIASTISCIGQIISLFTIVILTKTTVGSLENLAIYFAGIPFLTMATASIFMFKYTRYKIYCPSLKSIKFNLLRNIFGLGIKFFFIYLCLIAIFQLMNIILSRTCGPDAVTQYNIANKYFSVIYMITIIVVNPMWAAFTDAYTKKDYSWMMATVRKLEYGIFIGIFSSFILLIFAPLAYTIWLQGEVNIPNILSFGVMIFIITQMTGAVYMYLISGIGCMSIQFLIYFSFALVAYPLMTICCKLFGAVGIIVIPSIVYIIQAIFAKIQLNKIIHEKASGIWIK